MFVIKCPWCGQRGQKEFTYIGDANIKRPDPNLASDKEWSDYIFLRKNPKGWHDELWQHTTGCRVIFKAQRNTVTHEIRLPLPLSNKISGAEK